MADRGRLEDGALRAAEADVLEFTRLYRVFERRLLAFFMRATGRPELAADLAAETFARALEALAQYDPKRGSAGQWLFGIARNVLGSSFRAGQVEASARMRLGMPRLVVDDHAAETIARLSSEKEPVMVALAGLPSEQREAIDAHVIHDRDYADIAGELRCSEAVVRQRVSRGLKALRMRLAGER